MKHIHFIGICGTAMAPIAKMMHDAGWKVTGSDKGIFPPMSDYLHESGVKFYVGFHPEKMGTPDCVVVGNYIGPSNPELVFVQEQSIPYKSYPEVLSEYLIKPESIVVAGTYGKTTNTALSAWIWEQAGFNPSFMSGGILKNFSDGTRNTDSAWSIVEGDEYPSARWDQRPKFMHYRPKCLMLTGVDHDHLDVYPTEDAFVSVFAQLVASVPENGLIAAASGRPNVEKVLEGAKAKVVRYGRVGARAFASARMGAINRAPTMGAEVNPAPTQDWTLEILSRANGKTTIIIHGPGETIGPCRLSIIGDESLDHIAGVVAFARYAGIPSETIVLALETFLGVRRRLEVRGVVNGVTVIDDFGHSPKKAAASLQAIRLSYPRAHIIAVYEPSIGSRMVSSKSLYDGAFNGANFVCIPRLSVTKSGEVGETRMEGQELKGTVDFWSDRNQTKTQTFYEPDDDVLVAQITKIAKPGDVVVFLGSHGFRGMIEATLKALQ